MKRITLKKIASAAIIVGLHLVASGQTKTYKIGAVLPLSGPYAFAGEAAKRGIELAIEERGGKVLGANIELMVEDGEAKPQVALQKAITLIGRGANVLIGEGSSPATLALSSLAKQRKIPLLITLSGDERLTGSEGHRYAFRTANDFGMESQMAIAFLRQGNYKKIYGVIPDVGTTRDLWEKVKAALPSLGIEMVGEDFPPLGNKDFSIIVNKISKSGADVALAGTAGSDAINLVKQAGEVELNKKVALFGPAFLDDDTASGAGKAALGVYSGVRYHYSVDNPKNKDFVARYRAKFGQMPGGYAGQTYDGLVWWLKTVQSTGSWDVEKWVDAFKGNTFNESIEGTKFMRACNNQAEQVGLWARVVEGQPPLPPLTMSVVAQFPAKALFTPCP